MAAVVNYIFVPISNRSPDGGTDIAKLVRRALAEVCTVPVLLVLLILYVHY